MYSKLLRLLNETDFSYIMPMDGNRFEDGIGIRYRFGYEKGISSHEIATYLDDRPCSILEMMCALSLRCEEHIMSDPDEGNRTGLWFWSMIESLRLADMDDYLFNGNHVKEVLDRFIHRQYESNGDGGLFYIPKVRYDMRSVEIWDQMMWYLESIAK